MVGLVGVTVVTNVNFRMFDLTASASLSFTLPHTSPLLTHSPVLSSFTIPVVPHTSYTGLVTDSSVLRTVTSAM